MKIQIEFDLPEDVIAKAAKSAAVALFEGPSMYGRSGSPAYVLIEDAAKRAIAEVDWTPVVKAEIARLTPDVVHDVVGTALKALVKAQVKAMKDAGDLLT